MMFSSRELLRIPEDPVVSSLELVLLLRRLILLWDLLCCDDLEESCRMDDDLVVVEVVEFSARNWEMSAAALSLLFSGQALCSGPALRGRLSSSSCCCDLTRTTASSG